VIGFLELAQTLQMAIKALQMYTPAHPRAVSTIQSLAAAIGSWLQEKPSLHIAATHGKVFVDGAPVEGQSLHLQALSRQLSERQIAGFVIQRGVEEAELLSMLQILILKPTKIEEQGGVAKVMATLNLRHITLGQTQYREVREGEGGEENQGGPALKATTGSAPETTIALATQLQSAAPPLLQGITESMRQWKIQLLAASDQLGGLSLEETSGGSSQAANGRFLGRIPAADLSSLGAFARETGWTDGLPTDLQLEGFRKGLLELPAETRLGVLKGMGSASGIPEGLRLALETLAPEVFGGASTELLNQGANWKSLRENLFEILNAIPRQQQPMLAELESTLRHQAMDMGCIQDLIQRLEWDQANLDSRIRMVMEQGRLWELGQPDRLEFLRTLLEQGRIESFMQIIEDITAHLTSENSQLREPAAQTLAGVTRWALDPGLPPEADGLIQPALTAHFAWEPILQIHRPTEEAIAALLALALHRGDPGHAQALLLELEGLCAFLEDLQAWRQESLQRLNQRLSSEEMLYLATESLYKAESEAVLQVFVPYFEFLGEPAARILVQQLGEEPDRKRRGRLLEIIRILGPLAMPALQDGLNSSMWYLVRNTLNLLAEMGDAGQLDDIAQCLRHSDVRVRGAAIRAAWKLGGPKAAPHLLGIFPTADPETQLEIIFGLTQIQSAAAVPVLGEFAKNPQTPVRLRIKSAEALGQIGNPAAIPFLMELVRRRGRIFTSAEPTEVRLAGAHALAAIGTVPALDALKTLTQDEPRGRDKDALQSILQTTIEARRP